MSLCFVGRIRQVRCFASLQTQIALLPESLRQKIFKTPPLSEFESSQLTKAVADSARWVSGGKTQSGSSTFAHDSQVGSQVESGLLRASSNFPIFDLPELEGESIEEHFARIGQQFVQNYEAIVNESIQQFDEQLTAKRPYVWSAEPGWTEYDVAYDGAVFGKLCEGPVNEMFLVFDVEVNVATSRHLPILATAFAPLSGKWYSWTSEKLWNECLQINEEDVFDHLIPLRETAQKRGEKIDHPLLVVGHNVGFDRQYVKDEYVEAAKFCSTPGLDDSSIRYLDTMAMHQAVAGLTQVRDAAREPECFACTNIVRPSRGIGVFESLDHVVFAQAQMNIIAGRNTAKDDAKLADCEQRGRLSFSGSNKTGAGGALTDTLFYNWKWSSKSGKANLVDAYRLHCGGFPLHMGQKTHLRNCFVSGSLEDIRNNFQSLAEYCSNDVEATFKLLKVLYPEYRKHNPHAVTFAGSLLMGNSRLPADNLWTQYKNNCERIFQEVTDAFNENLTNIARETAFYLDESVKNNIWLRRLDWTPVDLSVRKDAQTLMALSENNSSCPKWYFDLIDVKKDGISLSLKMQITPLLIQMRYKGYPLYHTSKTGWGFLKPEEEFVDKVSLLDESFKSLKDGACCGVSMNDGGHPSDFNYSKCKLSGSDFDAMKLPLGSVSFFKLPHSSGNKGQNVGTPFSQDNITLVEKGLLTSDRHQNVLKSLIQTERATRFWISNKDRICSEQLHIKPKLDPSGEIESHTRSKESSALNESGWILPKMCVHGTLTRRATENTWLVATNAQTKAIGTELKCMIRAPDGFKFIGADVDSEELWIAALIGDSSFGGEGVKGHGVTPLGWMVVAGDKKDKTDMHSFTAGKLNLDRVSAKVVNYGRIYGAGFAFLKHYLSLNAANCDSNKASRRARMLLADTKGIEKTVLTENASCLLREFITLMGSINKSYSQEKIAELLAKIFHITFLDRRVLYAALESDQFICARAALLGLSIELNEPQIELDSRSFYMCSELISTLGQLCGFGWSNAFMKQSLVARRRYNGGTESAMFSRLEEIACSEEPRTPFLKSAITKALQPKNCGSAELTSRINWVVQSSAVDFLHLFMVAVDWIKTKYSVRMMFTLSIHDEVRYLVPDDDVTRACWVLQVAHLLSRSFFAASVGINDLPASVAYFSSIDVDTVMRKEPAFDCETFSNPSGLEKTYGIAAGLTITPETLAQMLESFRDEMKKSCLTL